MSDITIQITKMTNQITDIAIKITQTTIVQDERYAEASA